VYYNPCHGRRTVTPARRRCSFFPLEDLINAGMRGELFSDANGQNLEHLAERLTEYLWKENVRIYNKKRKA